MKINSLKVRGFRSLSNFEISFENDLTIIVGENDAGKSSLLDCLKIITQNGSVEFDDFNYYSDEIEIEIEIQDFRYRKHFTLDRINENINNKPLEAYPSNQYLNRIKQLMQTETTNLSLEDEVSIKEISRLFGLTVRSNSNIDTLRNKILEIIKENESNPDYVIENARFPRFNNIVLDGKHFENVTSFFKEVFLKEKQNDIWQEEIIQGTTIDDFIKESIENYSVEVTKKINETGLLDKLKLFIKDLTNIQIKPIYQPVNLNLDAVVQFLENGKEINLMKKGDGTKRRITMALLEFKKDEELIEDDETTIYLFDEPDTHLHVRAQIELLETMKSFAEKNSQVIITTHSPFLLNSVKPNQVRLLWQDVNDNTHTRKLKNQSDVTSNVLQRIGIENIYLYFAKKIIIVEGETEEAFIKNFYYRIKDKSLSSDLIKIINAEGIHNIFGFTRGISELHDSTNIFVIHDNDPSDELLEILEKLNIADSQKFIIGEKEFEDSFSDDQLCYCWQQHYLSIGKTCPESWTIENIHLIRLNCLENVDLKFSKEIRKLNASGIKFTKPIFGTALATYINPEDIPHEFKKLFAILEK